MKEITVQELQQKQESNEKFTLLDVRETFEYYICHIHGLLIPLDQLSDRLNELNKNEEIVVMCRSGSRSKRACQLLEENGFKKVTNLKGGVNSWAKEIDESLPLY